MHSQVYAMIHLSSGLLLSPSVYHNTIGNHYRKQDRLGKILLPALDRFSDEDFLHQDLQKINVSENE